MCSFLVNWSVNYSYIYFSNPIVFNFFHPSSTSNDRPQQVHLVDLLVTRIRLTRHIPHYDERLVVEACESGSDPMACDVMAAGFKFPADQGAS